MWLSINILKKKSLYAIEGGFICSLRKQPTFGDATTDFPAIWRLRNENRNSILMTCHYPDLGSASDWSCRLANLFQPILYLFLCRSVGVKLSLLLAEQRHKRALEVIGVLYRSQFFLWRKEQLYMLLITVVCTITLCDWLNWTSGAITNQLINWGNQQQRLARASCFASRCDWLFRLSPFLLNGHKCSSKRTSLGSPPPP